MAASLSGIPAIALSFGLMTDYKPPTEDLVDGAILASCKVVKQLWELGWGEEGKDRVDVYTVNVPVRALFCVRRAATDDLTASDHADDGSAWRT